jgi:hypothetical protein
VALKGETMHVIRKMALPAAVCAILAAPAWLAAEGGASAKDEYNTVTVDGRGADKEAAIQDALRTAVEKGAGQFIHSQTETKDFQVILDKILSKSAGFVKRYEVLKTSAPDASGIVTVRLTADVAVKAVATEWGEIQILLQQKGKPRLMVVIGEKVDDDKRDDSIVASEIEKQLLKNDFPLVDKNQFTEIQKREMQDASFGSDMSRIVAVGKQFGAELVIAGSAIAEYGSKEDLYGVPVVMYGASVRIKAVRTDNAGLLFSDNIDARKGSRTKNTAATEALRQAGADAAKKVQDGILGKWAREVAETQSVNLEVAGLTFSHRNRFVATLKKLKMVTGVQPRTLTGGIATFTVDIKGLGDDFAQALDEIREPKLEVIDVTANAIRCRIAAEQPKETEK